MGKDWSVNFITYKVTYRYTLSPSLPLFIFNIISLVPQNFVSSEIMEDQADNGLRPKK